MKLNYFDLGVYRGQELCWMVDSITPRLDLECKFYGFEAKVPAPYPLKEFDLSNQVAILGMKERFNRFG